MRVERVKIPRSPAPQEGYILPLEGKVRISQGYNGPWSHFSYLLQYTSLGIRNNLRVIDDRFCLDFAAPFGTEVRASIGGRVLGLYDDSEDVYRGSDIEESLERVTFTNHIAIERFDGPFKYCVIHSHLKKNSARVTIGEQVKQGQIIAETGPSGWIGGIPHLHLGVYCLIHKGRVLRQTFPLVFEDYDGPLYHNELN